MSFFTELKRRNVIRVGIAYVLLGWVVLQAVDFALDLTDAPNWIIQVFFIAGLAGLPVVLFLAWAFELTPEGLKRESEIDRSESITPQTGRKLDRVIIAFLIVAVLVLLADRVYLTRTEAPPGSAEVVDVPAEAPPRERRDDAPPPDRSIAVLPLTNRSTNPEDAFFAAGIHDELLTQLSRISALTVISRTSVMGYADTTQRMTEIGRELGVAHLLEGGVQRAGNRVRINVQLIEAASDKHLWAEVYDRELTADNLFDIQSDITRSIAQALQAVLTGDEERKLQDKPTENVEAYAFYLRAKAAASTYGRTAEQIDRSIATYQRAIDLDPDFAAAHAALSTDYAERFWISGRTGDVTSIRASLDRARQLAPDSTETAIAEGYFHYWGNLDYADAIEAFDRALATKPGSMLALRGKAYVLRRLGRFDEALDSFEQIVARDPLNAEIPIDQAYLLYSRGEISAARERIDQATALGVSSNFARLVRALGLMSEERFEEAKFHLGGPKSDTEGYLAVIMADLARYTNDSVWMDQLLRYTTDIRQQREDYRPDLDMIPAWIHHSREKDDALGTLLAELEPKLLQLHAESRDKTIMTSALIQLYALQGEAEKLEQMVLYFDEQLKPDFMRPMEVGDVIATAYALVGDIDSAMDRAEDLADRFGVWTFWRYRAEPVFRQYGDNPRYAALSERYEEWLRETRS